MPASAAPSPAALLLLLLLPLAAIAGGLRGLPLPEESPPADPFRAFDASRRLSGGPPASASLSVCDWAIINTSYAVADRACYPKDDACPESCETIFRSAVRACESNNTVTVLGETGTIQPASVAAVRLSASLGACNKAVILSAQPDFCSESAVMLYYAADGTESSACGNLSAAPPCPWACQFAINITYSNCLSSQNATITTSWSPIQNLTQTATRLVAGGGQCCPQFRASPSGRGAVPA